MHTSLKFFKKLAFSAFTLRMSGRYFGGRMTLSLAHHLITNGLSNGIVIFVTAPTVPSTLVPHMWSTCWETHAFVSLVQHCRRILAEELGKPTRVPDAVKLVVDSPLW